MVALKRFFPIIFIFTTILVIYITGLIDYLSFEMIKKNRDILRDGVETYPYLAPLAYVIFYIIITSLSLPVDVLLAMFGGFLFPQPYSTIFATLGATLGALCLFLATRTAFGNMLRRSAGPYLQKFEKGFSENVIYYLFFLRLIPIFPFWLVNITSAFLGVPFVTFAWTTLLGTIPAAFAFTEAGTGLGTIFDSGDQLSFATILNRDIQIALLVLSLFALVPVIVKALKTNFKKRSTPHD